MVSPISKEYSRNVRPKLDLIDKLQQVLERSSDRSDVRLPRIAVVGTQSSGKSSVLERLSGVQLPRGSDLCTRIPLLLCIKHEQGAANTISFYLAGKTVTYPILKTKIEEEVRRATKRLVGEGQAIEDKPITLRVSGPSLPDLTLVDLPGIIYTPKGNQPPDIYHQVKDLICKYIQPKETIILCVFAGDADLQTSEALKLAREVDPGGQRTIGVITKVDRVEEPAQLIPKLLQEGQHNLNIKLGLIALRNQRHTEERTDDPQRMEGAAAIEKRFFEDWKKLRLIPDSSWGIMSLAQRLCELQAQNLDACLPGVRDALQGKVREAENELEKLQVPGTKLESYRLLRLNFDELLRLLKNLLRTNYDDLQEKGVSKQDEQAYHVFPRIERVNQELQHKLLANAPKVFSKDKEDEIRAHLKEVAGRHLPNFLSPEIFNNLMIRWFRPYKQLISDASVKAIECVEDVVEKSAKLVIRKEFFEFARDGIRDALYPQFEQLDADTKSILEKEADVVHTQNDYYTVTLRKLQKALAKGNEMLPEEEGSDVEKSLEVVDVASAVEASEDTTDGWMAASAAIDADLVDEQRQDGMIPARKWLSKKLRASVHTAQSLQSRYQSHDPKEMHVLDLQLSAFCYDKVRRKRVCDDLMKNVRHYLLNFLEEDPEGRIRAALDALPHEKVHERLTSQSMQEKQRRAELEAKRTEYIDLLRRIDEAGSQIVAATETQAWEKWKDRKRKRSLTSARS